MPVKTVYDSAGTIVRVVDLLGDDPVRDAEIEDVPVGGGSVDGEYNIDTVYFVAGVATARPAVVVDPEYSIVADGEDSFWFEVPDETLILTPDGEFEATAADSLVSISSRLVGTFTIVVVPPEPYQQSEITLTVIPDDLGSPNLPPTTPDIEILLSQAVLTNLAVLAKPKFNVLSWDISDDPEHAYYGLTRYESEADADADVDGVDIEPITEAFYKDADEFVNGVDCWYRVWDVDVNGNASDKSDPVGEVARGVQTGDVEPLAIAPSKLASGAGGDNLVQDYDLLEQENFTFTSYLLSAGSGTEAPLDPAYIEQLPNPTADGRGNSNYLFHVTAPAAEHVVRVETARDSVVEEGKEYAFSGWYEPAAASFPDIKWYVRWWSIDAGGELDHISDVLINGTANSILYGMTGNATAPAGAVRCSLLLRVETETGETSDFYFASPAIRPLITRGDITEFAFDNQDTNTGSFGTSRRKLAEAAFADSLARVPVFVAVSASFVNDSGAAKTYDIEIEEDSGVLATVWQDTVTVGNGALFNLNCHRVPDYDIVEAPVSYNFYVTGAAGSNNLRMCRIFAEARMA